MNHYNKLIPWIIGILSVTGTVFAETDFTVPLTIPGLVDIALTNNPETSTAWWNAQRAAAATKVAFSAYYPNIQVQGNVMHGREYKFLNGEQTNYTESNIGFVVYYLLYDFGERNANNEAARAALCATNWQSDWSMQKVMNDVINSTYVYLNAQELMISRLQSLQDAQVTLDAAEELYRAGLKSVTDLFAVKATISDMKMQLSQQKADVDISRGKLAANLGIGFDVQFSVAGLPEPQPNPCLEKDLNHLLTLAQQQRADLMAKRAILMEKNALVVKASKAYYPKISFLGDTGCKRYWHDRTNGFNYNVGLYLEAPLFDGFESIYKNRIAYSDMRISETELEQLELDIALEVLTYSRLFESAQETLQLSHENLRNSIQSYEGVLEKYKAGTQSIFDLMAAQKQLADARIRHSDAKTRWYRSIAQLAYATGSLMTNTEVPCVTTE